MPRGKKEPTDDTPVQIMCNAIADGDKEMANECEVIMDESPNPLKDLKKTFGPQAVKQHAKKFSDLIKINKKD